MTAYEDILHLPHHVSARHAQMPIADRAAQFAPFAALTGYGDVIRETRRMTERRIELDEYEQAALNEALCEALRAGGDGPEWEITYFQPDAKKSGGAYVMAVGRVRRLDEETGTLCLIDGTKLSLSEITKVQQL